MHIPESLQPGDEIRIISTARKISLRELQPALNWLKSQEFTYSFGAHLFESFHQFAGTDKQRASDFTTAWKDPNVKAIWCARGGYGTMRIMDFLNDINVTTNPKWLIGYSDVTVLHAFLQSQNIVSIHGTMPINVEKNSPASLSSLKDIINHKNNSYEWQGESNQEIDVTGKLIGGNLSMLYSLNGTPWQPNTDNAILFIEDLDEYLYHIDRMLQTLKHSNWFANLKAIVVGGMTDMNDNSIPFGFSAKESIRMLANHLNVPVVFDFPAGHQDNNLALPFGQNVQLITGETNLLHLG